MRLKEAYVDLETAKLLKQNGFKGEGSLFYENGKIVAYHNYWDRITPLERHNAIEAPTIQIARAWLREKHNIDITVDPHDVAGNWIYQFHLCKDRKYLFSRDVDTSYENCAKEAIKYCLDNLIKSETKDRIEDMIS